MKNVDIKVEKKELVIRVDLTKDFGPSDSGKTIIVASTGAAQEVPGFEGFKVGVNVYKKPAKAGK